MKKILFAILLATLSLAANGQTLLYRYAYTVSSDGVKSDIWANQLKPVEYYTFTNNYAICYKSDENGNVMSNLRGNKIIYDLVEATNDIYIYRSRIDRGTNFYFSKDLKKINKRWSNSVDVWELVQNTQMEKQMY